MQSAAAKTAGGYDLAQSYQLACGWSGMVGHVLFGGAHLEPLKPFLVDGLDGELAQRIEAARAVRTGASFLISGMWFTQGRTGVLIKVVGKQTRRTRSLGLAVEYSATWEFSDAGPVLRDIHTSHEAKADA